MSYIGGKPARSTLQTSDIANGIVTADKVAPDVATQAELDAKVPSQSGHSGKYLTTDATNSSWATVTTGVTGITSAANATAITIDSSEDCNFAGHLMPVVDNSKDCGSASKRWRNIYTTDLHLSNDRGDWTVIEEEHYLTLRNNKTDKIYKLVMEEIK